MRAIVEDEHGVLRYKSNRVVEYLLTTHTTTDLNMIWKLANRGFFSKEDMEEFYQLIGYSITGYEDVFYEEE